MTCIVADDEIQSLVAQVLGLSELPAVDLSRSEIPQWDSLKHVEIVFALEDRYNVQFDEAEFAGLTTVAVIAASLRAHLAA